MNFMNDSNIGKILLILLIKYCKEFLHALY